MRKVGRLDDSPNVLVEMTDEEWRTLDALQSKLADYPVTRMFGGGVSGACAAVMDWLYTTNMAWEYRRMADKIDEVFLPKPPEPVSVPVGMTLIVASEIPAGFADIKGGNGDPA